ncbi:efflux RND transporter periplasmic adaptor subunit [Siphonobacter curvatus]|uniref:Efflux RND transporter periplasmic adaptor subunit n=1 Tax=Siphonobacter curvatus TaxID=2094562 RepID=A0A2S7IL79_9BACT|nr:efflux RND transporter periplasmic adaptor subunit [Siphonobacter curvatus]PQA58501.1 efflux RND transporter periplasmic adaptor subunit [Siphonobacter curvatus]
MKTKSFFYLLSLVALAACHSNKEPQEVNSKDTDSAFKTDTVHVRNYEQELQFTGEVSFDQKRVDRVFPIVSGNVLDVNAELGAYVKQGQVLAKLQSADVSQYQRDYNQAKAGFDMAKRNADNAEQLYKSKFSSESDLINARKQLEIATSELDRSTQVLKMYGGTSSGNQPTFLVKAPVSGYVVERNVNPNTQIRSDNGNSMFTISNLSDVWIMINIYESDIEAVKVGQQVNITTLAYPDKVFQGRIENISQVIDNDSKVLQARVVLPNPNGLLKPQMFCTIKLHIEKPERLLAVNPKSVIFSEDKYFVIKAAGKEKYVAVPVEVVRSTSRYSYVKGDLKDNDRVVTEGALLLFNELTD